MKAKFNKAAAAAGLAFMLAAAPMATSNIAASSSPSPLFENETSLNHGGCHPRRASIVINAGTGDVLSSSQAHEQRFPASMVKIMTLMLVFDELEKGTLTLDQNLTVSRHAASMVPVKLGLPAGSRIALRDALSITAVRSSNDLAVVLAEAVAGTEWAFANRMTQKARDIGMTQTTYKNASGLPHSQQVTTAYDTALLARHLIESYSDYYHYFAMPSYRYRGQTFYNTNRLMGSYPGMDGIKTGYTCASGFNLAASAVRGDTRLIAVTMGHPSAANRNIHMRRLLDQGFETARRRNNLTMAP